MWPPAVETDGASETIKVSYSAASILCKGFPQFLQQTSPPQTF